MGLSLGNALLGTTGLSTGLGLSVGNGLSFPGFSSFSPASLFAAGEQGVWYDPSDLTTLFQDSVGTTPVTAVEQPVGLMLDKSKGLVLGPELVTNGGPGFTTTTGWSYTGAAGGGLSVSGGELVVTCASVISNAADRSGRFALSGLTIGNRYKIVYEIRKGTAPQARLVMSSSIAGGDGSFIALADSTTPAVSGTIYFTATATTQYAELYAAGVPSANQTALLANISIKELPGNHAFQSTSAARPVLSARVNLLTKTEAFDDVAWTKTNISISANATVAPDGTTTADKMVENSANAARGQFFTASTTVASGQVTWSVYLKAAERQFGGLTTIDPSNGRYYLVADLTNGAEIASGVANGSPSLVSKSITSVGDGWYRLQIILNCAAGSANVWFYPQDDASFVTNTTGNAVYQGDGTSGTFVWGADIRVTNDGVGIPAYQRVNTSTDYDTTGFPLYLRFDGVDDSMGTASISFTSTNQMTVFGGVRKLTDTANIISELSVNSGTNSGSFYFVSGIDGSNPAGYTFFGQGTVGGSAVIAYLSPAVTAPNTSVLAMTGNIPGDLNTIRRNTVLGVNGTGDQGAGNYGNYPLYIGSRAGTSLRFNGRIYSLIVRGAASTATQISDTETWVNGKTKAY